MKTTLIAFAVGLGLILAGAVKTAIRQHKVVQASGDTMVADPPAKRETRRLL